MTRAGEQTGRKAIRVMRLTKQGDHDRTVTQYLGWISRQVHLRVVKQPVSVGAESPTMQLRSYHVCEVNGKEYVVEARPFPMDKTRDVVAFTVYIPFNERRPNMCVMIIQTDPLDEYFEHDLASYGVTLTERKVEQRPQWGSAT